MTQEFHYFVKVMIICTVGCLMMLTVASMPVAQKSSLDHLIIPYEDSPVDYGVFVSDQGSQFKDEPTVSQSNGYFLVNILFDDDVIVVQTTHYTIYSRKKVITTYNVGTFRQGDFLTVPLGASYTVGGPDHQNRLKKGIVTGTKRFSLTNTAGYRPGIVL